MLVSPRSQERVLGTGLERETYKTPRGKSVGRIESILASVRQRKQDLGDKRAIEDSWVVSFECGIVGRYCTIGHGQNPTYRGTACEGRGMGLTGR